MSLARAARAAVALALLLALGACAEDDTGAPHPVDRLDFPVGVTADPSGRVVWVTSGNFDLAYRGAAVLAIDVATQRFIPGAAFEIGGFPGALHLLSRDGQAVAGYVLSRDTNSLYHVKLGGPVEAPEVTCPGGTRSRASGDTVGILRCPKDGSIELRDVKDDTGKARLVVGPDPYGAVVRLARSEAEPDLLLTGALVDGTVASFTLDDDGTPELVGNLDLASSLFAFAVSPASGRVYTTHKSTNVFDVLEIHAPAVGETPDLTNPYLRLVGQVQVPEGVAFDRARDVAISGDGTRLYASYRSPDSLVVVDVSEDAAGTPQNRVLHKIPVSRGAGTITVVPGATQADERVFVSCYSADRVEVVDPYAGQVVASVRTGRGPFGMAFIDNPELGLRRLYVAEFRDSAVGVIELDPSSPHYLTLVAEIR